MDDMEANQGYSEQLPVDIVFRNLTESSNGEDSATNPENHRMKAKGNEKSVPPFLSEKSLEQKVEPRMEKTPLKEDIMTIPSSCPSCRQSADTNVCQITIPHFKEVLLMTLLCDSCGYRTSEVKPAGSIVSHGTKTTLRIQSVEDLKREVVLSDTAGIYIPDLELELPEGTGVGVYTTVEGLIKRMLHQLSSSNPFDDVKEASGATYKGFLTKLREIGDGKALPATLVINDPLSNSFIGPLSSNIISPDPKEGLEEVGITENRCLNMEVYARTHDQNEVLGLNHVNTDDY